MGMSERSQPSGWVECSLRSEMNNEATRYVCSL